MNTNTSDSEHTVSDIVSKLLFISKIKEGDVLSVDSLQLMQPGFYTSLYRTIFSASENRESAFEFFKRIIDDALKLVIKYKKKQNPSADEISKQIIESIEKSIIGIKNHGATYKTDIMYLSKIESMIMYIERKCKEFESDTFTHPISIKSTTKIDEPKKGISSSV